MAAVQLTPDQQHRSLRASVERKKIIRTSITTPFKTTWPQIEDVAEEELLQITQNVLSPMNLKRITDISYPDTITNKKKKFDYKREIRISHWKESENLRSLLIFGINAVTRALEKDKLAALIVCRNTVPCSLTENLIHLSSSNNIPAVAIRKFGNFFSKLLNFKSCRAVGFKKGVEDVTNPFNKIYQKIKEIALPTSDIMTEVAKVVACAEEKDHLQGLSANKEQMPADFSYLYIYKNDPRARQFKTTKTGEDFISIETSTQEVDNQQESLQRKWFRNQKTKKSLTFHPTKLKQVHSSGKIKTKRKAKASKNTPKKLQKIKK